MRGLESVCGSHCTNLTSQNSDVDIIRITKERQPMFTYEGNLFPHLGEKYHFINRRKDLFIKALFGEYFYPWSLYNLFPLEWLHEEDKCFFNINSLNEKIHINQTKFLFNSYLEKMAGDLELIDKYWPSFYKRYFYSLQHLAVLKKYPKTKNLQEAIWQEGEDKEKLLLAKVGELSKEDYLVLFDEWKSEVLANREWYESQPVDIDFLQKARQEIEIYIGE